jgi:hypothetical protein
MITEGDYWSVKYTEAMVDREAADVRFVNAFNPKVYLDGSHWCLLIGDNLIDGISVFDIKLSGAYEKMNFMIIGLSK